MIYTRMTRLALKTAYEAHKDQTDRAGLPYIFHPYHVAEQMKNEEQTAAALLHDVIEDTKLTAEDLRRLGFSEEVTEAVELLTRKHGQDYFDYIRALKDNPIARAVKLADLAHNSDPTRLDTVTPDDLRRFDRYRKAAQMLV